MKKMAIGMTVILSIAATSVAQFSDDGKLSPEEIGWPPSFGRGGFPGFAGGPGSGGNRGRGLGGFPRFGRGGFPDVAEQQSGGRPERPVSNEGGSGRFTESRSGDRSRVRQTSASNDAHGLPIGKKAPAFKLKDQAGTDTALDELLKQGKVAIVFYRSADW